MRFTPENTGIEITCAFSCTQKIDSMDPSVTLPINHNSSQARKVPTHKSPGHVMSNAKTDTRLAEQTAFVAMVGLHDSISLASIPSI
jgi:hypothetical protein